MPAPRAARRRGGRGRQALRGGRGAAGDRRPGRAGLRLRPGRRPLACPRRPATRREHLGVAALGGRIYVLGGRTAGLDSNRRAAEAYDPARGRWLRLPPMPTARGGTSAAAAAGLVVSVGGEGPDGTYPQAEAYDPRTRRWRSLPASPEPRHGLGVAASGRRVYALLGGPTPGWP